MSPGIGVLINPGKDNGSAFLQFVCLLLADSVGRLGGLGASVFVQFSTKNDVLCRTSGGSFDVRFRGS